LAEFKIEHETKEISSITFFSGFKRFPNRKKQKIRNVQEISIKKFLFLILILGIHSVKGWELFQKIFFGFYFRHTVKIPPDEKSLRTFSRALSV